ncbi:MAG: hypothetical protein K0M60_17865 [Hydrogenophaga sp.]|nr:hypothetical protein [Hydrogenophaga sp.]
MSPAPDASGTPILSPHFTISSKQGYCQKAQLPDARPNKERIRHEPDTTDATETIRNAILAKPDGILEHLAEEHGVSLRAVIDCLPDDSATAVTCARFVGVLSDVADWGDITFICHSKDAVVEFCGLFPTGRMGLWPLAPRRPSSRRRPHQMA